MPYHATPHHTTPYHIHTIEHHTISYQTIPQHKTLPGMQHHTRSSHQIIPYNTIPYNITVDRIASNHTIPFHIIYLVYNTVPYPIIAYHIVPATLRRERRSRIEEPEVSLARTRWSRGRPASPRRIPPPSSISRALRSLGSAWCLRNTGTTAATKHHVVGFTFFRGIIEGGYYHHPLYTEHCVLQVLLAVIEPLKQTHQIHKINKTTYYCSTKKEYFHQRSSISRAGCSSGSAWFPPHTGTTKH